MRELGASCRGTTVILVAVVTLSVIGAVLLLLFQGRLIEAFRDSPVVGFLGLAAGTGGILVALVPKTLRPYPLLRLCLILSPGLSGLVPGALIIVGWYIPPYWKMAASVAVFLILALSLIQWLLLPFALYQVFRKR